MKAYWVIGTVMAAGLRAQAADCSVNVYVITGAQTPVVAVSVLSARLKVTAMFRQIGVNVRLRSDIPTHDPSDACGAPIVVQFDDTPGYSVPADTLACALPWRESGAYIHVFFDRVVRINPNLSFTAALLAHVVVHETTHVLERSDGHSAEGVMKARWSHEDYKQMDHNPLPFAPEDLRLIRQGLAKRATHAPAE